MRRYSWLGVLLLTALSAQSQTPAATTLTLAADSSAPTTRQLVHLSATLAGATNATGTITYSDGTQVIARVALNPQGPTYLGVASLTAGGHTLSATYSGDAENAGSSGSLTLSVAGLPLSFAASASPASLYVNSSAMLTAVGLPADATGSVTFSDGASTLANVAITGTSTPNYQAFGDSITAGANVSDPTQHYVNEVAASGGFAFTNDAVPGAVACDLLPFQMLANNLEPTQARSPLSSIMIGTNDLDLHPPQLYEPLFRQCHQADLAWLAIPREYKILPADSDISILSGTWTASTSFDRDTFGTLFNASGSGTARFTITTTGEPIYLWYLLGDQLTGSFTIALDGTLTGQSYMTQPATPINSNNSPSIGYALVRLPASQGPHTVDVTSQAGSVGILAVATPASPGLASVHPTVLATDIPSQLDTDPPTAAIAAYTQDIQDDIALLAGDGLDIRFVPTQAFMQGSPAEMSDQVNPKALGQAHLAQAFASALANVSSRRFTSFINTAPTTSASFANPGVHTITAAYSGDNVYNSATAAINVNALPQASSATTLATPVTHAFFGAPLALTATVSAQSVTGLVTFFDGTQMLSQVALTNGAASFSASNLAVGIHNFLASYSGDAADSASASPQLALEIEPTPTTLTLAPLPAIATYSSSTVLSASIEPASATGTVTFFDNGISAGQATLNGSAGITLLLTPGQHVVTAKYSGDTDDLATSSAAQYITVQTISTTTTLASLPATGAYGTAVALVANVSPTAATGLVNFIDNVSGNIAQVSIASGVAHASINTLTLGSHTITAVYPGDATHAQSSSQPAITQIVPAPTSIALAAIPAIIVAGASLNLRAQVTPASATGSVLFRNAVAGTLGLAPVVRGVATLTLNSLAAGAYSITAQYSGDSLDATSTSAAVITQIILAPTIITLVQPTTSFYAAPVSLHATIIPATATGEVQFSDASGLFATSLVSNGAATAQLATLSTGSHSIRAVYSGDSLNAAAISAPGTTLITADPTTTAVTLAQTNVPAGGLVTFDVAVTNSQGANPTGTVGIRAGSTTLAQAQLANASNGKAYATISVNAAALGSVTVVATYPGDTNDQPSTSAPATYTVIATPTVATLSLSATAVPLQTPVTLTVLVASANAVPTGQVVFASNGIALATVPLNSVGQASTTMTSPPLGAYAMTATFVPAGLFAVSVTGPETLTVTMPLALTISPANLTAAAGSRLSATLTILPLSNFSGTIAATCQSPKAWLTCSVSAPASVSGNAVSAPVYITLKTNIAAATLPFLTLLLGPLAFNRRRRRALFPLLLAGAMLASTACAEGGNFFNLPNGPQQLTLAVTAAGVQVTIPLIVNVSQ